MTISTRSLIFFQTMDDRVTGTCEYRGKKVNFNMTKHIDPCIDLDKARATIAEWIVDHGEEDHWIEKGLFWIRLLKRCRIFPVNPNHPLFELLDQQSRRAEFGNWLIFKGHLRDSGTIKVTHFGPFGREKNREFKDELEIAIRAL